ncbi:hypothetical protein LSH36_595g03029 [Paralvinella palmiformis]|uniref:EGF-like domain-containing protein n=1 Tax=Paralvinella palmiformis TaxID=53620 RepID=A0AAD9MWE7_9ANNE|nr:hypothetical protein LSH36_595g03029 [Paralvinella palmiformis]
MKYIVLLIAILWAFVGRPQGTIESYRAMGLYLCTECEDWALQCQHCSSGYTLKSDKTGCLTTCPDNCTNCTTGDSTTTTKCTTCNDGYYVNNDACAVCPIDNCKTCTDGTCNDCVDNFYYNGSSCNACNNNCAKCEVDNLNYQCHACEDGYYTDQHTICQKCFTDCATCTSGTTCTQCVIGKGLAADKLTCTDCATLTGITNCATCVDATSDTSAKCVSCTTGYTISDDAKECFISCYTCGSLTDNVPTSTVAECNAQGNEYLNKTCEYECFEGVGAEPVSGKCYISCYTCGSLTDNVPSSTVAECNAQGNEYLNKTCEYECFIAIKYDNNEIIFASRGCVVNATCLSDGVEQCTDTGPSQVILVE